MICGSGRDATGSPADNRGGNVPKATLVEPRPRRRDRVADAVRPFASRPYRPMWMGSTTSSLGDALVQIALVFAILHVGGTASDIGVVAAVKTVAQIAFLLAGGVWADRLRRQYVMLTADALRGVVQATLAALLLTGHAHVWELGVGAALYGSARSSRRPTRGSVSSSSSRTPCGTRPCRRWCPTRCAPGWTPTIGSSPWSSCRSATWSPGRLPPRSASRRRWSLPG
jgi:hypothetical protein